MILLEEIPQDLRSAQMEYLFAKKTYIQWPGADAKRQKHFWEGLKKALKPPRRTRYAEDDPNFLLNIPQLSGT